MRQWLHVTMFTLGSQPTYLNLSNFIRIMERMQHYKHVSVSCLISKVCKFAEKSGPLSLEKVEIMHLKTLLNEA